MNDNAIKNYATWARRELIAEVEKRCVWWGISEGADPEADTIDGRVLTAQERKQRRELLKALAADGRDALVERAAYTWFNRLLAIRFMEANDRLPSHVRVLSSPDGSFEPQCLAEALGLPLDALDRDEALRLVQEGDDEGLFRLVFLAQCAELAECMPAVFEPVGSAMELLLPTGLLRAEGVVGRLVTDIDEADWREGVEIVGWMYQYYVSERKDEVFASFKKGKKAERDAIAPATQLFTPHWIVRYLTENSLGRLWMLNHPDSRLVEQMSYYVKPDEEHETEFRRIASPEDITVVDPACGSGHILVYAFDLLLEMYRESGYRDRDAARLIIEKNLTGLEIDPRAAAMASFALTMRACDLDKRFLRRGVVPRVTVLKRVELTDEELEACPNVAKRKALVDAAAHLDECGSLFKPEEGDLDAIERDLASLAGGASLFAGVAAHKLGRLRAELAPLAARYDVVVANPPYMGNKNMNRWLGAWVRKTYPDVKGDLFSCFIANNVALGADHAQLGFMTPYVWMFIGTYEKLRRFVIVQCTITS
ncbi:MAG: BREX-1 system adenine-specific DNA-methyltransferase PglX, partial [Atopobiaceae bacterium]|nr:BREX-1 system adenine-specific DNA-methyltransferase PglX [Atopobiaceae bacterium]